MYIKIVWLLEGCKEGLQTSEEDEHGIEGLDGNIPWVGYFVFQIVPKRLASSTGGWL